MREPGNGTQFDQAQRVWARDMGTPWKHRGEDMGFVFAGGAGRARPRRRQCFVKYQHKRVVRRVGRAARRSRLPGTFLHGAGLPPRSS